MDKKHCQIHLCVKSVCAQRAEPLQISQSDKSREDENVFNESITFRIKLVTFATKLFFKIARCPVSNITVATKTPPAVDEQISWCFGLRGVCGVLSFVQPHRFPLRNTSNDFS